MSIVQRETAERQRSFRRRGVKYVLLSLLLTAVVLVTSGCSLFLFGNDKKAYDCIVASFDYFYYPSTVEIVSGEMSSSYLYCRIRAHNKYGYYVTNDYSISSSGYIQDSSSYRCRSSGELNINAINRALRMRQGTVLNNIGEGMKNMGFIYVVIIIVAFLLNGLLASKASDMAAAKGYDKSSSFHLCFWLGPIAYIIVAAMPDRVMQSLQLETNNLLKQLLAAQEKADKKKASEAQQDISSYLPNL